MIKARTLYWITGRLYGLRELVLTLNTFYSAITTHLLIFKEPFHPLFRNLSNDTSPEEIKLSS